jgi:hypothetical protein
LEPLIEVFSRAFIDGKRLLSLNEHDLKEELFIERYCYLTQSINQSFTATPWHLQHARCYCNSQSDIDQVLGAIGIVRNGAPPSSSSPSTSTPTSSTPNDIQRTIETPTPSTTPTSTLVVSSSSSSLPPSAPSLPASLPIMATPLASPAPVLASIAIGSGVSGGSLVTTTPSIATSTGSGSGSGGVRSSIVNAPNKITLKRTLLTTAPLHQQPQHGVANMSTNGGMNGSMTDISKRARLVDDL